MGRDRWLPVSFSGLGDGLRRQVHRSHVPFVRPALAEVPYGTKSRPDRPPRHRTWLVRVYTGRDPETKRRTYLNQTIYGGLRDAQAHLNKMLSERDRGRKLDSSKQTLNRYLDRWLELCAKPRLRAKSLKDYEGLLRRYVRLGLAQRYWHPSQRSTFRRSTEICNSGASRPVPSAIPTRFYGRP